MLLDVDDNVLVDVVGAVPAADVDVFVVLVVLLVPPVVAADVDDDDCSSNNCCTWVISTNSSRLFVVEFDELARGAKNKLYFFNLINAFAGLMGVSEVS